MNIAQALVLYVSLTYSMASYKPPTTIKAIAVVQPVPDKYVHGVVHFEQMPYSEISISINISGLTPGKHGFHVHTFGDISTPCSSTGPHYNPFNKTHGGPNDKIRHLGDLGNIVANKYGRVITTLKDRLLSLKGKFSIIGRAVVVHPMRDDLGRGTGALAATSKINGNSGTPIGCGVIGFQNVDV